MGLRFIGSGLGWLFMLAGMVAVLLYLLPSFQLAHRYTAMAASFIPYGVFAWLGALIMFLVAGHGWTRALALVAAAGLALQIVWTVPYFPLRTPPAGGGGTTLLTFNSRCDGSWREDVAKMLIEWQPDIAVIQGSGKRQTEALAEAGLEQIYPYEAFFPMETLPACGTRIYSKNPLTNAPSSSAAVSGVQTEIDGVETTLLAVDTTGPQKGLGNWEAELGQVQAAAVSTEGPLVVAGDFNATAEHIPIRSLTRNANLSDATAHHGWLPTWRANRWPGPLIQIDHVFISNDFTATNATAIQVGSSAHKAILVTLRGRE